MATLAKATVILLPRNYQSIPAETSDWPERRAVFPLEPTALHQDALVRKRPLSCNGNAAMHSPVLPLPVHYGGASALLTMYRAAEEYAWKM